MELNGDAVHGMYAALAARDWDGVEHCFTPDAVWHLPGAIAGDHRGWPAIRNVFSRLGPLSGGTFRAELLDVTIGARYVVAVQHATGQHEGRTLDITGCQLIELRDGLISDMRGHYSDEAALSAFWREPAVSR